MYCDVFLCLFVCVRALVCVCVLFPPAATGLLSNWGEWALLCYQIKFRGLGVSFVRRSSRRAEVATKRNRTAKKILYLLALPLPGPSKHTCVEKTGLFVLVSKQHQIQACL